MTDQRITKLAQVLVHYSLELHAGDLFLINASPLAGPLVREVYREALLAGAHPVARFTIDGLAELLYRHGSREQLTFFSQAARQENEEVKAALTIHASANTKALTGVDPHNVALRQQAIHELSKRFWERAALGELNWAITIFPTQAFAQEAEMSLADYEDFVYGAGRLDEDDPVAAWLGVRDEQQRIADILSARQEFRVIGPDTDLTYRTGKRRWINAAGRKNFPDGEVFTSPVETSAEGYVRFSYPAIHAGREVEDVRLVFREGKVIEATAAKGVELLHTQLDLDEGARRLGEVAFGTNYNIQHFTRNILFDEKIGGTMHLALGTGFPEIGGQNSSALHWDMVCDLRAGSTVYADGDLNLSGRPVCDLACRAEDVRCLHHVPTEPNALRTYTTLRLPVSQRMRCRLAG